jgi:hypothetical protein
MPARTIPRLIAILALMISVIVPLHAVADETQKPAITSTIQGQIDAFLADDFDRAFTYASPMIKNLFGNARNFGAMVRQGYPMVHRPSDLKFLDLRRENGRLVQKVQVRDAAGRTHLLDYSMIKTDAGWQINGVQLLKNTGLSA